MNTKADSRTNRRDFLRTSTIVAALAAPMVLRSHAAESAGSGPVGLAGGHKRVEGTPKSGTIKVGLIGCGGRGSGAASQALSADKDVVLTAMGDVFEDQLQKSLQGLQKAHAEKVKVTAATSFVGLDAYQKVIESGVDVVLLATPPGFRPMHLKAAVAAGKHVFCEKPVATDAAGVRSVIESVKAAEQKKLSVVSGFCWRYDDARRAFYQKIHSGAIGEIRAVYATYYTGPVKPMPPASERPSGMSDLEWQLKNWYNFVWLSGDGYVEQCCHSVDKVAWAMKDIDPIKAVAVGGRQKPNNEGNIYDHMFVVYEYPNDVRAFVGQRQVAGTYSENSDYLMGSEGFAKIPGWQAPFIKGKETWRYRGTEKTDMYQNEHNELFAGLRCGKLINDGEWMAHSTMMGIMGRMAAYTGQEITWEQAMNAPEKLVPEPMDWKMKLEIPAIPQPGVTKVG